MMLNIYTKYVIRQLNAYFFGVLFVLIAMIWLTQSLRLIDLITNKGIDIFSFFKVTGLLLTPMSYLIIPIAILISAIMLMNRLSHDREIVVLRNAGFSNFQIAKPFIIYAVLITLFNYSVSFYFMPKSYREYKDNIEMFKNKYLSLFLEEGIFNTQISNLTVYIDEKTDDSNFKGIFIYDNRNPEKPKTIMADRGSVARTNSGPEFVLQHGSQQEESKTTGNISLIFFDSYRFNLSLFTETALIRNYDANELYINQLLNPQHTGENVKNELLANGHQRLVWPMYSTVLVLVSLGMMLSGFYSRRTQTAKNIVTAAFSASIVVLSLFFNNLSLKHIAMAPLLYVNCIVFLFVGIVLLRKHHQFALLTYLEQIVQSRMNLRKLFKPRT